jgi:hypothetical protein
MDRAIAGKLASEILTRLSAQPRAAAGEPQLVRLLTWCEVPEPSPG